MDTPQACGARRSADPDTAQEGMPISTQQETLRQVTVLRTPPGKARRNRSDLCHGRNAARTARDQAVRRHQSYGVVNLFPSHLERGRSKLRKTGDRVTHFSGCSPKSADSVQASLPLKRIANLYQVLFAISPANGSPPKSIFSLGAIESRLPVICGSG